MKLTRTSLALTVSLCTLAAASVAATADDGAVDVGAPSFFSGTAGGWEVGTEPVAQRRADGVVEFTGESYTYRVEADDPRISGTATIITNETDYREGATTLVDTGHVGTIRTGRLHIANDGGSWVGTYTNLEIPGLGFEHSAGWLAGSDAYEGLSAYYVWDYADDGFRGHITAEGPPPIPDLPAE